MDNELTCCSENNVDLDQLPPDMKLIIHKLDFSLWYLIAKTRFCKIWSCYVQPFRRRCIYKKLHYFTFDLDLRSWTNMKHCPVSSTSYDLCICKVWRPYVQRFREKCIYKKYMIWPWSCDVCTCKVWSCYSQRLRRCITKKIHYLILTSRLRGSRLHKMLPSTLDFM